MLMEKMNLAPKEPQAEEEIVRLYVLCAREAGIESLFAVAFVFLYRKLLLEPISWTLVVLGAQNIG